MEVNGAKGATVLFSVPSMDSWQLTTLNGGFPAIGQYIGVGKTSTNALQHGDKSPHAVEGVEVRLEQREEEVALVKPGEEIDKGDGDHRRPDHIFAANPLGNFRVAKELPRQIKQQPCPQPILR